MNNFKKLSVRIDLYLFYIRIHKSRNIASKFISNGKLKIGNQVIRKPHKRVFVGDVLTIEGNFSFKVIEVLKIPFSRGPFSEAIEYYKENSYHSLKKNTPQVVTNNFMSRVGRPTKLHRRKIDKLMGRN